MSKTFFELHLLLFSLITLIGCAGPTSPFGAIEFGTGDGYFFRVTNDQNNEGLQLSLTPKRQMLHKASPLKIEVNSLQKIPSGTELKVIYNQKNVTSAFHRSTIEEKVGSHKHFRYIYKNLRLKPDRKHEIDLYIMANDQLLSHQKFLPPDCSMGVSRSIASTEPFSPPNQYLETIKKSSNQNLINPTFLTGLIAQESGFNSLSVSWAKGIGLTQVTPLADEEIRHLRPEWKRDPRIQDLSSSSIEKLIKKRKLSKKNDWRLDPDQAIEGGVLYLNYLRDYWNHPENKQLLSLYPTIKFEDVVLASYNSGAARVKNHILKHGDKWIEGYGLKEAFKYVNNVTSYCYHFSQEAQ